MEDNSSPKEESNSVNRRTVLSASSAAGGALLGYGGLVGSVSADDEPRRGTHPTPEELERSLTESNHIGIRPKYNDRVNRDELSSLDELPTSVTPGRDHPEIYFGKFKNAQAPSGKHYSVSDADDSVDTSVDTDDGPISVDKSEVSPNFVSFEEEVSCAGFDPFGELCVKVGAGVDLEYAGDSEKFGGKLYIDLTFEHSSGAQITVSPGGFGIYVDPGVEAGICFDLPFRNPGPIPGKGEAEVCLDYTFTVEGSDVKFGVEISGLEVCVEDDTVCADIVSGSAGFEFTVADVDDVPFL